jgi:hypothetical protein
MNEVTIDGLDLVDVLQQITRKKAKFIKITLDDIEKVMDDRQEYLLVRKAVLDGFNDYTRSFMRAFFGDIEGSIMK